MHRNRNWARGKKPHRLALLKCTPLLFTTQGPVVFQVVLMKPLNSLHLCTPSIVFTENKFYCMYGSFVRDYNFMVVYGIQH